MVRRPPRATRTDTLFPYTTLFRSKESFGLFVHSLFPMKTDLTLVRLAPFQVRHRIVNHRPFPQLTVLYLANHGITKDQHGAVASPCLVHPAEGKGKNTVSAEPTGCTVKRSEEHTYELQSLMRIPYA